MAASLRSLDLEGERLKVGVSTDLVERGRASSRRLVRPQRRDLPSGSRAASAPRRIVTVPAEKGDPRNLTNTLGANERDPAWSPDGKSIAWFSDASGENRLVVAPQDGQASRRASTSAARASTRIRSGRRTESSRSSTTRALCLDRPRDRQGDARRPGSRSTA